MVSQSLSSILGPWDLDIDAILISRSGDQCRVLTCYKDGWWPPPSSRHWPCILDIWDSLLRIQLEHVITTPLSSDAGMQFRNISDAVITESLHHMGCSFQTSVIFMLRSCWLYDQSQAPDNKSSFVCQSILLHSAFVWAQQHNNAASWAALSIKYIERVHFLPSLPCDQVLSNSWWRFVCISVKVILHNPLHHTH